MISAGPIQFIVSGSIIDSVSDGSNDNCLYIDSETNNLICVITGSKHIVDLKEI